MQMKEEKIRGLMVEPNEYPKETVLKNELRDLQEAVGGLIDIIGLDENTCILLNDEGKLIGLEGNRRLGDDIIAGTFYVCGNDAEGNLTSLNDADMKKYEELFYEPEQFTQEEFEKTCIIKAFFLEL